MTAALSPVPGTRERIQLQASDDPGTRSSWRERAACREAGTELFFPIGATGAAADETRLARQICASCPVRTECLTYALTTGQQYGIWGGLDEQERRAQRQQQAVRHPRRPAAASGAGGHPPAQLDGS